jgi:hypothetical protein
MADMIKHPYGTKMFYKEQFDDILADVQGDSPYYGENIVDGFIASLQEWRNYHQEQVNEYERVEQRVREASAL